MLTEDAAHDFRWVSSNHQVVDFFPLRNERSPRRMQVLTDHSGVFRIQNALNHGILILKRSLVLARLALNMASDSSSFRRAKVPGHACTSECKRS